jgi:hypothetical protein
MPLFLMIAGSILALLGVGSIAAGAPDWALGLSIGATLVTAGAIALVGGLILIGLSQVLTTLLELQRRLEMGAPAPAPVARAAIAPPEDRAQRKGPRGPAPAPAETGESGEPPRPRRAPPEPQAEPAGGDPAAGPRETTISIDQPRPRRERSREAPAEELARPRRPNLPQPPGEDMLRRRGPAAPLPFEDEELARPRTRQPEPSREEIPRVRSSDRPQKSDDPLDLPPIPSVPQPFSGEGRRGSSAPKAPEPKTDTPEPYIPKFRPAEPAPARGSQGSETVVRSGVIGGMAYTLYADGSIEAELPIGTVRFNSIAELQDHVMRTGAEADGDFSDPTR